MRTAVGIAVLVCLGACLWASVFGKTCEDWNREISQAQARVAELAPGYLASAEGAQQWQTAQRKLIELVRDRPEKCR